MNWNKKWMIRIFCGFLAVMAAGTVISRAAASVLVARVEVEKPGRGKLTYSYEGEGTTTPAQENQIFLWPEQQVEWIAKQGSTLKAGECLVQFSMEYLKQQVEKKQAEVTQLELQASQQQVSAMEQARVPAVMGAGQSLEEARRQLDMARQKEAQAQAAYNDFMNTDIPEIIDDGQAESVNQEEDNSVWLSRRQELESALQEARANVESARQAETQAQNAYELAKQEDAAQDANAANAAKAARIGAEASFVQAKYAKKELERLQSYQAADGKICADQDCTVLKAGVQAGAFTTGSEVLVTGMGGWKLKGMVSSKDQEKLRVGTEVNVQLGAGKKRAVKIESIGMEAGGAESAGAGAEGGGEDALAGDNSDSMQTFWIASMPEDVDTRSGEHFTWNAETPGEKEYEQTIPLSALREDMGETYCLVLTEEEQMLGTVQTAKKVPVTVLEKDAKNAAVMSALTPQDQVIVSSEKYVSEGDRVRLKD